MMKILKSLAISATLAFAAPLIHGATVMTNEQQAIVAIGSLSIGGTLYDVSFDGSFGTSMFLGNQAGANAARDSITLLINSYGFAGDFELRKVYDGDEFSFVYFWYSYFPWPFPTIANQSGLGINGTGTYYEITYAIYAFNDPVYPDRRDFYYSEYSEGWIYPDSASRTGSNPRGYVEAKFREAIPGSIPHTLIPEPGSVTLLACGGALLLTRRNRRATATN
jgi:hypothetical protein